MIFYKKDTHFISKDLNDTLNMLSLLEERALYVIVKELKKQHFSDTEKVDYDFQGDFVRHTGEKIMEFELSATTVKLAFQKNKIAFSNMIDLFQKISTSVVKYYVNGDMEKINLFDNVKYISESDSFLIVLNEEFYDFIILGNDDKMFFKIYHEEFFKLTSIHQKSLYRLCSIWVNLGKRTLTIDEFKRYFGLSKKYRNKDIDTKLLQPAMEKINDLTGFNISYIKTITLGKISHITFSFKRK